MDIEGVGEQFVRRLWDEGLLRSMPDLYRLTPEQLMELDGYAEISAGNAVAAIQASKEQPFYRVLLGLNIPKIGWVLARNLATNFGNVDRLSGASLEELEQVEGIGADRAELVAEWFSEEENLRLIEELRGLGLRFETGEEAKPVEGRLSGQTYVITGTLEAYSRDQAKTALEELGESDGLGLDEDDRARGRRGAWGSKLTKAQRSGVPLLTEAHLEALLSAG